MAFKKLLKDAMVKSYLALAKKDNKSDVVKIIITLLSAVKPHYC